MSLARLLSCACLASWAFAQEVVWDRDGVPGSHHFNSPLGAVVVGDLDGDEWEDAVVMVEVLPSRETELWFLSGRNGTTLRTRAAFAPLEYYRVVARTGDMNGDGVPDYAFATSPQQPPFRPAVEVASGIDDSLIWRVRGDEARGFGEAVLGDLDVDGDGKPDLIVNEPVHPTLRYHVFDNAGRPLYTIPKQLDIEFYRNPLSVARLGDLDGDGADEWMAGGGKIVLPNAHGAIVFSGRTGRNILRAFNTSLPAEQIGTTVQGIGDLDGDGVQDLVATSNFGGTAAAFSGADGRELRLWRHPSLAVSGVATSDLDRDGVDDVVFGLPVSSMVPDGTVIAYSGRDGGELFRSTAGGAFGVRVDLLRTPDDGHFPMFLAPMPQWSFFDGRIRAFRATPRTVVVPAAPPCLGGLPQPPQIGLRDLQASGGHGARVHLSAAPPGVGACLVLGLSDTDWNGVPLPFNLSFVGLPGCALYTSIDAFAVRTTGTTGLDRGYAFVDLPFDLSMTGVRVHAQWLLFGATGSWPGGLTRPLSWLLAL